MLILGVKQVVPTKNQLILLHLFKLSTIILILQKMFFIPNYIIEDLIIIN